jgi:Sulfotransferase family
MRSLERPIFLVGAERSGTTLLRLMLDSHPEIAFNLESEYLVSQISPDGGFPEIARYRDWLNDDRVFRHSRFRIDETLDFPALLNSFLDQKKSRDAKNLVGATVHHHFARLRTIWPRARYLYLYRDGRDVANSVMRMGWAGNSYVAADRWLEAEREWDQLRPALEPAAWIEVRYEDLVAETRTELERICAFIGVAFSEKMLDYVRTSTYAAPDPALKYQWKTGMRKLDLQRLEAKLGDGLSRRGYPPSTHPRIAVSPLTRRYLGLQSRFRMFLDRLERFGVALTLRETLSRRLGLKQAHREAIRRIDQIVDANLK